MPRKPLLAAALCTGLAVTGLVALAPSGVTATTAPVTFVDNFDGYRIDTTRWTVGNSATNWSGIGTGQCHRAGNVTVSGGVLRLKSTLTASPFTCRYPSGATFRTRGAAAEVNTKGKFSQAYGSWQVRARFSTDARHGASALWMLPQKPVYGAWPRSGEIDIAERMPWSSKHAHSSVHYLDASGGTSYRASDGDGNPGETVTCAVDTTQWHVYGVVWNRQQMTFTVDGRRCATLGWDPRNVNAPAPFDRPFFTILRQSAVIGASGVRADRVTLIDWVKVTR